MSRGSHKPYLGECVPPELFRDERRFLLIEFTDNDRVTSTFIRVLGRVILGLALVGCVALGTAAFLWLTTPARGQVAVPAECILLAQAEGIGPVLETKWQILQAVRRLKNLSKARPGVRECQSTVEALYRVWESSSTGSNSRDRDHQ